MASTEAISTYASTNNLLTADKKTSPCKPYPITTDEKSGTSFVGSSKKTNIGPIKLGKDFTAKELSRDIPANSGKIKINVKSNISESKKSKSVKENIQSGSHCSNWRKRESQVRPRGKQATQQLEKRTIEKLQKYADYATAEGKRTVDKLIGFEDTSLLAGSPKASQSGGKAIPASKPKSNEIKTGPLGIGARDLIIVPETTEQPKQVEARHIDDENTKPNKTKLSKKGAACASILEETMYTDADNRKDAMNKKKCNSPLAPAQPFATFQASLQATGTVLIRRNANYSELRKLKNDAAEICIGPSSESCLNPEIKSLISGAENFLTSDTIVKCSEKASISKQIPAAEKSERKMEEGNSTEDIPVTKKLPNKSGLISDCKCPIKTNVLHETVEVMPKVQKKKFTTAEKTGKDEEEQFFNLRSEEKNAEYLGNNQPTIPDISDGKENDSLSPKINSSSLDVGKSGCSRGSMRRTRPVGTQPGSAIVATQMLKTKLCLDFRSKGCSRGEGCPYAHSNGELRALPDLTKTKICPLLLAGKECKNPTCRFAHRDSELRVTCAFSEFRTRLCKFAKQQGGRGCLYGTRCPYAHDEEQLRELLQPTRPQTDIFVLTKPKQRQTANINSCKPPALHNLGIKEALPLLQKLACDKLKVSPKMGCGNGDLQRIRKCQHGMLEEASVGQNNTDTIINLDNLTPTEHHSNSYEVLPADKRLFQMRFQNEIKRHQTGEGSHPLRVNQQNALTPTQHSGASHREKRDICSRKNNSLKDFVPSEPQKHVNEYHSVEKKNIGSGTGETEYLKNILISSRDACKDIEGMSSIMKNNEVSNFLKYLLMQEQQNMVQSGVDVLFEQNQNLSRQMEKEKNKSKTNFNQQQVRLEKSLIKQQKPPRQQHSPKNFQESTAPVNEGIPCGNMNAIKPPQKHIDFLKKAYLNKCEIFNLGEEIQQTSHDSSDDQYSEQEYASIDNKTHQPRQKSNLNANAAPYLHVNMPNLSEQEQQLMLQRHLQEQQQQYTSMYVDAWLMELLQATQETTLDQSTTGKTPEPQEPSIYKESRQSTDVMSQQGVQESDDVMSALLSILRSHSARKAP